VDKPDQHIRHTRRFKIGVDGHQARHRIQRYHENISTLAPFTIAPSLRIWKPSYLLEIHSLTGHVIAEVPATLYISHRTNSHCQGSLLAKVLQMWLCFRP
jgi:hypothetical protein